MDFTLTDEQLEFQQKCRKFAREVIRPLADKYDREQAVPCEAIKAAREWNLHGIEHIMAMGSDPEGLLGVIYAEELHWGCAGIALAISASSLAAAGIAASGTPEQVGQVGARVLRRGRRDQARRLRRDRGRRRLRRQVAAHHRQARRRRVGAQRHQGLHLQRRHRRRERRRRHRRPRARPPRPGLLHRHQGHARPLDGQEGGQDRHPRVADRGGRARGRAASRSTTCWAAWRSSRRSSSAPARARPAASPTRSPRSRSPARWWAPRRSASRRPPTSGRSSTSRTSPTRTAR